MENSIKEISFVSIICFLSLIGLSSVTFYSAIGVSLFIFFGLKFFAELGKTIEIRDLIILIALLEWIVGAVLKYHLSTKDVFYYMAVPEEEYMNFALPASLFFIMGLYFPGIYKPIKAEEHFSKINSILIKYPKIDLILIFLGVISNIMVDYVPLSLRYFVYLIGLSRYIGLFFLLLNERKYKWQIFGGIILWLVLISIRETIFHELLLWLIFLFIVIAFLYRFGIKQKLMFLIPFLLLMVMIQSVKFFFRQEVSAYTGAFARAGLFTEMVSNELGSGEKTMNSNNIDAAVDRINQGWIVARIMRYTPYYEPFANGETIISAVEASLVPRFFNPNKQIAGGRNYFERFTGKKISNNTSMGLSPLGEAYANFGVNGGILFMFVLGLFYNFYMLVLIKLSDKFPSLILWLPLLFLQVVKAETDFLVVLNHLVKASIVVAMIIIALRKTASIKI